VSKLAAQKSRSADDLNRAQSESDVAEATPPRCASRCRAANSTARRSERPRARLASSCAKRRAGRDAAVDDAAVERLEHELDCGRSRAGDGAVEDVGRFEWVGRPRGRKLGHHPSADRGSQGTFEAAVGRIRTGQPARLRSTVSLDAIRDPVGNRLTVGNESGRE